MGDRANAFIQTDYDADTETWSGIGIYSHWHGTMLHDAVTDAIPKAMARRGDPSYFARIVIHNVLLEVADPASETGTGLWVAGPDDNEHPILVVNAMTGQHWLSDEGTYRHSQP